MRHVLYPENEVDIEPEHELSTVYGRTSTSTYDNNVHTEKLYNSTRWCSTFGAHELPSHNLEVVTFISAMLTPSVLPILQYDVSKCA